MATGRFIHRSLLGTSLAAVAILAWAGSPAGAATDVSPPTWTKVPAASIPAGAALDEIGDCGSVEHELHPVYVDYQAVDAQSGIDHYMVYTTGAIGPEDAGLATRITMSGWTTDPADCHGGGRPNFFAQAVNGSGLSSVEYGWDPRRLVVVQDPPSAVLAYTGTWAVSKATTFWRNDPQDHAEERRGPAVPDRALERGHAQHLRRRAGHGEGSGPRQRAGRLDGVKVTTISTRSPTKVNRTWSAHQPVARCPHAARGQRRYSGPCPYRHRRLRPLCRRDRCLPVEPGQGEGGRSSRAVGPSCGFRRKTCKPARSPARAQPRAAVYGDTTDRTPA